MIDFIIKSIDNKLNLTDTNGYFCMQHPHPSPPKPKVVS